MQQQNYCRKERGTEGRKQDLAVARQEVLERGNKEHRQGLEKLGE